MRSRIKYFLLYGLFWFVFFVFARILFLIYHGDQTAALTVTDILLVNLNGFRLDLSTMGYFMVIPGLLFTFWSFLNGRLLAKILNIYTGLLLFASSFLIVLDCELYEHWGFRLDATPLLYISKEAVGSEQAFKTLLLVVLWLVIFIGFGFLYVRFYTPKVRLLEKSHWKTALAMLLLTGCLIGPIRGTIGVAPINTGTVYFHDTNLFANHAAVNVIYNTGQALAKLKHLKYPSNYFDAAKTTQYAQELFPQDTGKTAQLIHGEKPNVIIIILESYTFKFIEALGGRKGIAPNLNRLIKEGVLFDNFYAAGDRTDKGIVAVLSGYPTQPVTSIIKSPKKTQSLPFLSKDFKALGYETGFTYGGNIDFANFRSYFTNGQFDHVTSVEDFPTELNTSKWGVADQYVFDKFYDETNEISRPFFKAMITLSSHEPFEVPMKTVIKGDDEVSMFLNSAYYADKSLGAFIEKARKTDWWKNTLVVITADHGHFMPDNWGIGNPDRFKIPMIWLGGALAVQDTVIHSYAGQVDIANTILAQLGQYNPDYTFSHNILSSAYQDYALFVFNNGFGYLDHGKQAVYDNTGKKYMSTKGVTEEEKALGKAYLQTLYNDFNKR